ncbi:hypothetical protein ACLOJK_010048 [Asimina triloba]
MCVDCPDLKKKRRCYCDDRPDVEEVPDLLNRGDLSWPISGLSDLKKRPPSCRCRHHDRSLIGEEGDACRLLLLPLPPYSPEFGEEFVGLALLLEDEDADLGKNVGPPWLLSCSL